MANALRRDRTSDTLRGVLVRPTLAGHVRIKYLGVLVEAQERGLQFYTNILGFKKVADVPIGEARRLTVTSSEVGWRRGPR